MANDCPKCGRGLTRATSEDGFGGTAPTNVVLVCEGCGGVWLDNETTQQLVKRILSGKVLAIADRARDGVGSASSSQPYRDRATGTGACPICEKAMPAVRTTAAAHGVEGLELEVCAAHGTWFDVNELRAMEGALDVRDDAWRAAAEVQAARDRVESAEIEEAVGRMGVAVINRAFVDVASPYQYRVPARQRWRL